MSKYVCGRCRGGFDDLALFGEHACAGVNPMLAAFGNVINLHEFSIDLEAAVKDLEERHRIEAAVNNLEDHLRRGDLSA